MMAKESTGVINCDVCIIFYLLIVVNVTVIFCSDSGKSSSVAHKSDSVTRNLRFFETNKSSKFRRQSENEAIQETFGDNPDDTIAPTIQISIKNHQPAHHNDTSSDFQYVNSDYQAALESLPEFESRDHLQANVTTSGVDTDVERLVRTQLEWAANDWTTFSPLNDLGQTSLAAELSNYDADGARDKSLNRLSFEESVSKYYPNHNYKSVPNTSDPLPIMSVQDPMTTLSDASSIFGSAIQFETTASPKTTSHNHFDKYNYRLRGPITPSTESEAPRSIHYYATRQTTLSPNITKAYQKLDRLKSSSWDKFNGADASELNVSHDDGHNAASQVGKISSKGFMDVMPQVAVSNAQQMNDHQAKNRNQAHDVIKSPQIDHLPAPIFRDNLNGSLADRLRFDRLKNSLARFNSSTGLINQNQQQAADPLTVNLQKLFSHNSPESIADNDRSKPSSATQTRKVRPLLRSSTLSMGSLQESSTKAIEIPQTNRLPGTRAPTINLAPALFYKQNRATTPKVVPSAQLTTLLPVTFASSPAPTSTVSHLSTAATNQQQQKLLAARHHHLHSHIHSIKPAVISIPIPVQSKLVNPYDGVLAAAAAAAAAAATAAASSRPLASSSNSRLTMIRHPLALRHQLARVPAANSYATKSKLMKVAPTSTSAGAPSLTIPIGGKLKTPPPVVHTPQTVDQTLGASSQVQSSLLANLLDSANKALRQVVIKPNNLLRSSNATRKTGLNANTPGNQLGNELLYPLMMGADNPEAASTNTGQYMDTIGLYQAAGIKGSLPLETYLASLLTSAINNEQQYMANKQVFQGAEQLNFVIPSNTLKLASQPQQSDHHQQHMFGPIDWDHNFTAAASNNDNLSNPNEEEELIYASLDGNSNFLYPIMTTKQAAPIAEQPLLDNSNLFLDEAFHQNSWPSDQGEQQSNYITAFDSPGSWPGQTSTSKVVNKGKVPATTTSRPSHSKQGSKQSQAGKQVLDSSIPYALSHYVDEPAETNFKQMSSNNDHRSIYDIFDDKANKHLSDAQPTTDLYSLNQGQDPFQQVGDSFTHKSNHSSHPKFSHGKQNSDTSVIHHQGGHHEQQNYNSNKHHGTRSVKQPAGYYRQHNKGSATNDYNKHMMPAMEHHEKNLHHQTGPYSSIPMGPSPAHIIQLIPSDLAHHALYHAGSSLKPHILATAGDLINYHKQQLVDHHYLVHHPHLAIHHKAQQPDMATSESATSVSSALARGTLLAQYWPLALAMMPIMIIIAIMAQLVMAAPLVMFALTTLTVSRFAGAVLGPINRSDEDTNYTTERDFILPYFDESNKTYSNKTANAKDRKLNNSRIDADKWRRRRRR